MADDADVVERLRTFWREVTESDGGESPQMAMTREAADEVERLRSVIRDVLDQMFSTYKARNGRQVGIQDDSGEMCWIVPHEPIHALEAALTTTEKTDGQS